MIYSKRLNICSLCYTGGPFIHLSMQQFILVGPKLPVHPSPTPFTLEITSLSFMSVSLFLFHRQADLCHMLDSTYKWYHIVFVFLFLTYFTQYDNLSCINVAANGIILSFFMAVQYSIWLCVYTHTHTHIYTYISHLLIHPSLHTYILSIICHHLL